MPLELFMLLGNKRKEEWVREEPRPSPLWSGVWNVWTQNLGSRAERAPVGQEALHQVVTKQATHSHSHRQPGFALEPRGGSPCRGQEMAKVGWISSIVCLLTDHWE